MLGYSEGQTPPFNSPYQHHTTKPNSLLESSYPSPARTNSHTKFPQGLGLYNCQQPDTSILPPSPQPSEVWQGQYSASTSPLVTEAIANPWASGAFDHPVRSPLHWNSEHTSPRSSLSSCTRSMSVFSHDGAEQGYAGVKLECSGWTPEVQYNTHGHTEMPSMSSSQGTSLTVAPERLSVAAYPYDNMYHTPPMSTFESTPVYGYSSRIFERAPSESSVGSPRSRDRSSLHPVVVPRERSRNRRHTDPATAAYHCPLCPDKGFARRYNYNQHMLTHDSYRKKDNICPYPDCGKEFVRKTDLARHDQSVHQRSKPFRCARCPSAFSRKDTLRRHEEDGCPRRDRVPAQQPRLVAQLRSDTYPVGTAL